jgi:membrane associated rhomboid family serine protease
MFQQLTPITKNIIILNVIVFVLAYIFPQMLGYFAAFFPTSPYFKSWQIITHMFMHGGFMHIAFNMLTLASFGPVLERFLGDKKFLILYFLSGFGALALNLIWEGYQMNQIVQYLNSTNVDISSLRDGADIIKNNLTDSDINALFMRQDIESIFQQSLISRMVGASGAIFGVVAAFATLYPNAEMMIMFIPFPIKAKVLFPIAIVVSLFLGISGSGGNIAHFAHIGGALVGFLLVKYWGRNRYRIN